MKKVILFLAIVVGIAACGICKPQKPQPSESNTEVHYIDSVRWHDSTVYHTFYKERYKDFTSLLDTLRLSTTYSDFQSWVDTTSNTLQGTAENKQDSVPVKIKWKERIVYKDSIHVEKIPYPVEVTKEIIKYPKSYWWFLGFTVLAIIYIGIRIYLKFRKI